jgi:hypothetical protein
MGRGGRIVKIKTIVLIVIAYGIVFGGFYTYLKTAQLKEPLFLTHYYQKEIIESSSDYISIYYISNIGDNRQLLSVQAKEMPDQPIYIQEDSITYTEGLYNHHHAYISVHNIKEDVLLEEMSFTFTDGTVVETDIGVIQFVDASKMQTDDRAIDQVAGGSSNTGESYAAAKVVRDSTLTELDLPFQEQIADVLDLSVNSSDIPFNPENITAADLKTTEVIGQEMDLPLKLQSGDTLKLNAIMDKATMYKHDIHAIELWVTGHFTIEGRSHVQNVMGISESPNLNKKDIKALIKMREEGE